MAAGEVTKAGPARRGPGFSGPGRRAVRAASTYLGVGGMLVLLTVFLSLTQDNFATKSNWINIFQTNAVLLVAAVGLTFVLLVGGFDLSLGGILAASEILLHSLLVKGVSPLIAIVLVVLAAGAVGLLLNGLLIAGVGLSFLVVTLGSSSILSGAALVATGRQSETLPTSGLITALGSGTTVWGVPWSVVIALVVLLIGMAVLRFTGYGRMIYAVGGNPEAARLAGINVVLVRASVYGIAALLTGLAATLDSTELTAASPTSGQTLALSAGAAVLLGGTTFTGGRGTQFGTLLGVLFFGVLSNGITLAGVSAFWQGIVSGIVLIMALLLDRLRRRGGAGP